MDKKKNNTTIALQDSITMLDVIDKLGINLNLKEQSGGFKNVGNCITGHASDSETCFHIFKDGFFCHSCGVKGNIFEAVKLAKGVDYFTAKDWLINNFKPNLKFMSNKEGNLPPPTEKTETYLKAAIYEELYKFGKELLYSDRGAEALVYLLSDRNYEEDKLRLTEWFYLPPEKEARTHLLKTFSDANEETKIYISGEWKDGKFTGLALSGFYGDNFRLAFPYRDRSGNITGFLKRASAPKGVTIKKKTKTFENVRYDSSIGLSKKDLFNLWRYNNNEEILLVEGYPDALYFHTLGIDTVAVGQGALSSTHIKGLKAKGIKRVIISFDNDGKNKGEKHTLTAIELLLKNDIFPFVLPPQSLDKYKDLDELLKGEGETVLKEIIKNKPLPHYLFTLNNIYQKISKKGELGSKDIIYFLEEVVLAGVALKPMERDLYSSSFLKLKGIKSLGISKESLEATLQELRYKKDREEQSKGLADLLKTTEQLQKEGKTIDALELLGKQSKQLITQDKKNEFEKLLVPVKEEGVKERLSNKPESLDVSLSVGKTAIELPSGAISILAAPTSHGKTTLLINLILNVAIENPNKEFHLFSYEEDKDSIIANVLNTCINKELSANNRKTIKTYFATGSNGYFSKGMAQVFEEGKEDFFRVLIKTGRIKIHYVDYSSDMLGGAISFLKDKTNIGGVFIDYMQLLRKEEGRYNSRQEELKRICLDLKDLAVDTGLPIALGAQFNRTVINHLAIHSTAIGEAGDIERIANFILGFWNNEFVPIGTAGELNQITASGYDREGTIYAKILKNRGGKVGDAGLLGFNGNTGKITNDNSFLDDF